MLRVIVLASVLALQVLGSPVSIPSSLEESLQFKGTVDVFLSLESPQPILSVESSPNLITCRAEVGCRKRTQVTRRKVPEVFVSISLHSASSHN